MILYGLQIPFPLLPCDRPRERTPKSLLKCVTRDQSPAVSDRTFSAVTYATPWPGRQIWLWQCPRLAVEKATPRDLVEIGVEANQAPSFGFDLRCSTARAPTMEMQLKTMGRRHDCTRASLRARSTALFTFSDKPWVMLVMPVVETVPASMPDTPRRCKR